MKSLVAVLALVLLAGCGSTPKAAFYTLRAGEPGQAAGVATMSVGVGPVSLPEAVDRPQMVLRGQGNAVEIDEFNRWAEPLESEIPRVVAGGLAARLPEAYVAVFPFSASLEPDLRVELDVQRFESVLDAAALVEVHWVVKDREGHVVAKGRAVEREPAAEGYQALVEAHARALDRVAAQIVPALGKQ